MLRDVTEYVAWEKYHEFGFRPVELWGWQDMCPWVRGYKASISKVGAFYYTAWWSWLIRIYSHNYKKSRF